MDLNFELKESAHRPKKKRKSIFVKFNFPEKKKKSLSNVDSGTENFDSELLIKHDIRRCSVLLERIEVPEDTMINSAVQRTESRSDAASISKKYDLALLKKHRIKHCSSLVSPQCPVKEFSIYHGQSFFQEMAQDVSSLAQMDIQTDIKESYKHTELSISSSLNQHTFEKKLKKDLESQQRFEAFKKDRLHFINAAGLKKLRKIKYNESESIIITGDPSAFREALRNAKRIKVKLRNDPEAERLAKSQDYNNLINTSSELQLNGTELSVNTSEPSTSKSDGHLFEDNHENSSSSKESSKCDSTSESLSTNENTQQNGHVVIVSEDKDSATKSASGTKSECSTLTCNSIKRGQTDTHDKEEERQSSVINSDKL